MYLPPDANRLLSVADHCLKSRNYVNLIVIDKQPQLQYLDMAAAHDHCSRGASVWDWAGNVDGDGNLTSCSRARAIRHDGDHRGRKHSAPLRARSASAGGQCGRPDDTVSRDVHPHGFTGVIRCAVYRRHRHHLRVPRLPALHELLRGHRPPTDSTCTALRAGHDRDTVRHGRAQRDRRYPSPAKQSPVPALPAAHRSSLSTPRRCSNITTCTA